MEIVLPHHGDIIPDHFQYCLEQIRIFNPDINIHILLDNNTLQKNKDNHPIFKYNAKFHCLEDFPIEYNHGCLDGNPDQFWDKVFKRTFYLEQFCKKYYTDDTVDIVHFDNDVMIYFDIQSFRNKFKSNYPNIGSLLATEYEIIHGFMYIQKISALTELITQMKQILKSDLLSIRKKYGMEMVNDMTLYGAYRKDNPNGVIKLLPSLPIKSILSNHLDLFEGVFDPIGYGQYLGGTHHNNGRPGWSEDYHYIGNCINRTKIIPVLEKENGFLKPYVIDRRTNQKFSIHTLHIHSKQLAKFRSII